MCEKRNEARFGHRFWCTAMVKKNIPIKKVVEEEEERAEDFKANEAANQPFSAFSEYVEGEKA